jgi:hypothetical protein
MRDCMNIKYLKQVAFICQNLAQLSGPEGSRKLRFPDFMTMAQDGVKVSSLMH